MKILDSCYLIDLLNNKENALRKLDDFNSEPALFITNINVFELALGIYLKKNIDKEKKMIEFFKFIAGFEVLELNTDSAIKAAEVHSSLISKGEEIGILDSLIIGVALTNKVDTIITKNKKHFERIDGLKVEDY